LVDVAAGLAVLARHPAVDRVLCDGGPGTWPERARRLSGWAAEASGGLQMLAGGGITDDALIALSEVPGLREVHVGQLPACRTWSPDCAACGPRARHVPVALALVRPYTSDSHRRYCT
jgi:copper homeostasis protein CutC